MKNGERRPELSAPSPIGELSERSREIFRLIVDGYVQTGEPISSWMSARASSIVRPTSRALR